MLCELSIKNFAIIDDLKIRFAGGLTVLSGETGAGKSIIINAVNLLLGSRASSKLIRTGEQSAELEAFFEVPEKSDAASMMKEHGFDSREGLIIRRIISSNDRHRIYINGNLATIQVLTSITENIASISGQHAHQGLLKEDQHLLILDQYGKLMPLRRKVASCFEEILPVCQKLNTLKNKLKRQTEQIDLFEFQKKEISEASLCVGEDEALEKEKTRLRNAGFLHQTINEGIDSLYSAQGSVFEKLSEIKKQFEKALKIDPDLSQSAKSIDDVTYLVEDIAGDLGSYIDDIQVDESRLEVIDDRLNLLNKLKRKYGGQEGSLENVLVYLDNINTELSGLENLTDAILETEKELDERHQELSGLVLDISEKREKAAEKLDRNVEKELASLEMPKTRFNVFLKKNTSGKNDNPYITVNGYCISETGIDQASFMMAPNLGEDLKPLASIASGGELSRVVLALKAILAKIESVGTVVFDEVDAGIGGSVAEVVGHKISALSEVHQIICITHLSQIAQFGDHHYKISKQISKGRTTTSIHPLSKDERIKEIARMIGGVEITKATLDHAREIMKDKI